MNVAVFVPEGIAISSDSLAFLKNDDDGYMSAAKRTFCLWNRFILSFAGNGYIDGLPYGYYVNSFCISQEPDSIQSTKELAEIFGAFINKYYTDNSHDAMYFAGYDRDANSLKPVLLLSENTRIKRLNYNEKNSQILYNYHAIGNILWINKLFLPTTFKDSVTNREETFQAANIDFSKYSLSTAIDFSLFFFDLTRRMEVLAQLRPSINEIVTTALITPLDGALIMKRPSI